jgi:sulfide:quinone oxidoreductase
VRTVDVFLAASKRASLAPLPAYFLSLPEIDYPHDPGQYRAQHAGTGAEEIRMDIRKITDELSVSPQIHVADVVDIAVAGFRAVICNRPDGESADQPSSDDVAIAVRAAGLEWRMLPVTQVTPADVNAFGKLLAELPKPVLAYCRSGTRCTALWSLSEVDKRPTPDILARTRAAGYDMSVLVQRAAGPRV